MKALLFTSLIIFFISCKKEKSPGNNLNLNNKMNAAVKLSSGETIQINQTGRKVNIECSIFGGTYIDGTSEANAAIYIDIWDSFDCITRPGTYTASYSCQYRPNVTLQSAPIYINNLGVINPGSITFTKIGNHYAEGNFNAICKYLSDSVMVSGTFSGYLK